MLIMLAESRHRRCKLSRHPANAGIDRDATLEKAKELVELGFFEQRGTKEQPTFWVPFLYRDALHLVQGRAEADD
jgi:hypothetical protein